MKKNFREALIYLVEKHKKDNNIVGDFCRDCLDFQYKEEMEDPARLMEFIANECHSCDAAIEAMNIIRKKYNAIVDRPEMRIVYDHHGYSDNKEDYYGRKHYGYKWYVDAWNRKKHSIDECETICNNMYTYMDSIPNKYCYNSLI